MKSSKLKVVYVRESNKMDFRKHIKESHLDIVMIIQNQNIMYKYNNIFDFE